MKYICNKCGCYVNEKENFCKTCGKKIEYEKLIKQESKENKVNLSLISMIIGIFAILFSILINLFSLPLSITGLILGIVGYKNKKKKSGIILNTIAILIPIIIIIIAIVFFKINLDNNNYIAGNYECRTEDNKSLEYDTLLSLKRNKRFVFGNINDINNNHLSGKYEIEEYKTEVNKNLTRIFEIELDGDEYIVNGNKIYRDIDADIALSLTYRQGREEGLLTFENTNNTFYCIKK